MATIDTYEWNCSSEEYHADKVHVSHSALETFRRSRRLYHGRYVTGELPRPEPTAAMRIGTLLHLAVLEPSRFQETVAVAPVCDRRTKEGKAIWQDFCDDSVGKTIASADEAHLVRNLADSIMTNKIAREWLEQPGKTEHSIVWQDEETGRMCKSRRDRVLSHAILDLKTCRDASPEAFARAAASLGYYRQSSWYLDGEKATGGSAGNFLFVAVCTEAPHEVACYEPHPEDLFVARCENRIALGQLTKAEEYDDWLAPHEKQQTVLRLPRWANYSKEWEIEE